jgi:uncharacterized protein (TIGR00255 family)
MPLRSMTGFGAAEGAACGGRLRLEIRTVNHRHLSVQLKVPSELASLEADLRERLRTHFERGHATVSGRWVEEPPAGAGIEVDVERARAVVEALRAVGKALAIPGDVDLATVARIPDVVRVAQAETKIDPAEVLAVLDKAAQAVVVMREREGKALAADLLARLDAMKSYGERVESRAPARLLAEVERLRKNVQELAGAIALDPARLAQEIAHIADRLDITEELVRLRTHLDAARQALTDGAAVGKQLGFLLQELGRETNTIGSKANDAEIAQAAIAMKGELEKIREQIENLE